MLTLRLGNWMDFNIRKVFSPTCTCVAVSYVSYLYNALYYLYICVTIASSTRLTRTAVLYLYMLLPANVCICSYLYMCCRPIYSQAYTYSCTSPTCTYSYLYTCCHRPCSQAYRYSCTSRVGSHNQRSHHTGSADIHPHLNEKNIQLLSEVLTVLHDNPA